MEILEKRATEGSTYIATCTFEDENGDAVTPASDIDWTVRKTDGTEVSSGTVSAAATAYVVIKGTDLSAGATSGNSQVLTLIVETTYDGDRGSGLPLKKMAQFIVNNELGVP